MVCLGVTVSRANASPASSDAVATDLRTARRCGVEIWLRMALSVCDHWCVCGVKRRGKFLGLMMLKVRALAFLTLLKAKRLEEILMLLKR